MIVAIGQPPPAVFPDVATRAERNQRRYLQFLYSHPGEAAALQDDLVELGVVAFDLRNRALWAVALTDVWH